MPGENSLKNTIECTHKGRYIEMGRIKIILLNKVPAIEVLVVSENVASWMGLTKSWTMV